MVCILKFIRIIHSLQEIIQIQLPDQKYPTLPFYIPITHYVDFTHDKILRGSRVLNSVSSIKNSILIS